MDRKEVFDGFRKQCLEIADHYGEVEEVSFEARLKNGTRFTFDYDAERFDKDSAPKTKRNMRPVSVTNGVADIISACVSIALLTTYCVAFVDEVGTASVSGILALSFWTVSFIVSAVYHLFDEGRPKAVRALSLVRMGLLAISAALLCGTASVAAGGNLVLASAVMLFLCALAVFLASLSTRGSNRAANVAVAAMYATALLFCGISAESAAFCVVGMVAGLVPALTAGSSNRIVAKAGTFPLFYLASAALWFMFLSSIW